MNSAKVLYGYPSSLRFDTIFIGYLISQEKFIIS